MRDFRDEIAKANNEMNKTIVIDLDGVIVDFKNCKENCDYTNYPHNFSTLQRDKCPLDPKAIDTIKELKSEGYTIIINTSRVEDERDITLKWLKKNNVPYDKILFNKPRARIYIDDLAHKFVGWNNARNVVLEKYTSFEDRKKVYLQAQEKWGINSQITVAIEEFAELITSLCKRNRNLNSSSLQDVRNEIADAMVMLEHLLIIFGKDECEEIQRYKVARLKSWFKDVEKMIEE